MYSNTDSLRVRQDIQKFVKDVRHRFYSKFCAATVLSSTRSKMTHYHRAVHETNLVAIPLTQIRNVLYDAMRRTRKWATVLVVMPMNVPVRRGEP